MTTLTQNLKQSSPPTQVNIGALSKQLLETKKGVDGALKKMREQQEILKEKMGQIEWIALMCEESEKREIKDFAGVLRETGDINIFHGGTILMCSALFGEIEIVKALLARSDILINKSNNFPDTALTHAAEAGNIEIIEILLADPRMDIHEANQGVLAYNRAKNKEVEKLIESHLDEDDLIPF